MMRLELLLAACAVGERRHVGVDSVHRRGCTASVGGCDEDSLYATSNPMTPVLQADADGSNVGAGRHAAQMSESETATSRTAAATRQAAGRLR
jgi:hypothetical protein